MKPEERLSVDVRRTLERLGCIVYSSEQGYRRERGGTRCTPGQPDLVVFAPQQRPARWTWAELKAGRRRLTEAQARFGEWAEACGAGVVVWRTVEDAVEWWQQGRRATAGQTRPADGDDET